MPFWRFAPETNRRALGGGAVRTGRPFFVGLWGGRLVVPQRALASLMAFLRLQAERGGRARFQPL